MPLSRQTLLNFKLLWDTPFQPQAHKQLLPIAALYLKSFALNSQTFNLNRPARSPTHYLSLDESKVSSRNKIPKKILNKFSTSFAP